MGKYVFTSFVFLLLFAWSCTWTCCNWFSLLNSCGIGWSFPRFLDSNLRSRVGSKFDLFRAFSSCAASCRSMPCGMLKRLKKIQKGTPSKTVLNRQSDVVQNQILFFLRGTPKGGEYMWNTFRKGLTVWSPQLPLTLTTPEETRTSWTPMEHLV